MRIQGAQGQALLEFWAQRLRCGVAQNAAWIQQLLHSAACDAPLTANNWLCTLPCVKITAYFPSQDSKCFNLGGRIGGFGLVDFSIFCPILQQLMSN